MKKRLISCSLTVLMILTVCAPAALAATATAPAQTSNISDHDYINFSRWTTPVNSYLVDNGDGTLTRVEYTGEAVTVETYDSDLQFVDGFTIDMELPIFGGFYSGEGYNFLVFGQENPKEDDTLEVIRVVSYTKDWERVGAAGLYGANTTVPFDAGCLRFAEYNGYLYIRTAHEMYMSDDGYNHQSNLTLNVRIADMVITDSLYDVADASRGYVSHSFNQFIAVDGTDLVAVDHGDAFPRSVVITRYLAPAGQDKFLVPTMEPIGGGYYQYVYAKNLDVLPIMGNRGANDTGVAVGGFEISDSAYLIAGNTVAQDDTYDAFGQRNIFITATSKENFTSEGTTIHYLTSYAEGDNVTVSNPHFVKVENNKYAILWTESDSQTSGLRYAFVDGSGELLSEIYTTAGVLSDCAPIVSGGKLIWYTTSASAPAFYTIDPDDSETPAPEHDLTYTEGVAATCYTTGTVEHWTCRDCGLTFADEAGTIELTDLTAPMDPSNHPGTSRKNMLDPTCIVEGYTGDIYCPYCGADLGPGEPIPTVDHYYVKGYCIRGCKGQNPIFRGDMDLNGVLNVYDMIALKDLIISGNISEDDLPQADTNQDGKVNAIDIIYLKSMVLSN